MGADTQAPSLLIAMHRRYEQTYAEHEAIEIAEREAEGDKSLIRMQAARKASSRESTALRLAILYQVPADLAEAAILQFHIVNTHDLIGSSEDCPEEEPDALATAMQTLFDFLACEMEGDHEETAGVSFRDEAVNAYFARCYRTGQMGE